MNYGRGLLAARSNLGLSQRQLAAQVGLSPSYIAHIEAGRKKPSLDALELISRGLGLPMHVLMLLSAENEELEGISVENAARLATRMQSLLAGLDNEQDAST